MRIRLATHGDYDAYCELVTEIDALHTANEPKYFKNPGVPPRKMEFFEGLLKAADKVLYIAEVDEKSAGYLHLEIRRVEGPEILVSQDYVYVSDIVVGNTRQRRGLGRAMMAQAELWARQHGLRQIRLNVRSFNTPAIQFYESLGMAPTMISMVKNLK